MRRCMVLAGVVAGLLVVSGCGHPEARAPGPSPSTVVASPRSTPTPAPTATAHAPVSAPAYRAPTPIPTTPAPAPVTSCTTTSSGTCIQGGQFCPQAKYGTTGYDANGRKYVCSGDTTHPHWQ